MSSQRVVAFAVAGCLLAAVPRPAGARTHDFVPPAADDIVNVKVACGARGDGATDDTAALKAAFEAGKSARHPKLDCARRIYLPAGVYLVSDTLNVGDKKKFIIGQSRERTVIRLRDRSAAFQDAGRPRPVVNFGKGSRRDWHFAQNFNQRMVNLTIDAGRGNPGAVGVLYHTNNLGGIYHLTIRSSDPKRLGACGLYLSSGPGPGLAWDVAVDGFDVGCRIDGGLHSMTVGRLTVTNQRECGYKADGNFSAVWGMRSRNAVPAAVVNKGHFVLLDAECSGGVRDGAAVRVNGGVVFCRNIETSGYGKALVSAAGKTSKAAEVEGPLVREFVRPRAYSLFGEKPESVNLPVEEPPVSMAWGDPGSWTVIAPVKGESSAARIQKAIDGGAETVYLCGWHELDDTIRLRNRVKRVFGAGADFRSKGDGFKTGAKPLWRVEDGEAGTVYLEFLCDSYGEARWSIDHASRRTLVCRSAGGSYRNTVTGGKAFFLDGGPSVGSVVKGPQEVFAWQTNTESYEVNPHILNDGGTLFICGYKIEKDRTNVGTQGGGFTEVLGGLLYKNRQRIGMAPAFFNHESNVSISIGHYGRNYDSLVEERRGGETRNLTPATLGGHWVPLYSGRQGERPARR